MWYWWESLTTAQSIVQSILKIGSGVKVWTLWCPIDEIVAPIVRVYTGAVVPGFILVTMTGLVAWVNRQLLEHEKTWLAPMLAWLKFNRTSLEHFVSVHPTSPGCRSVCPEAQCCLRTPCVVSLGASPSVVMLAPKHVEAIQSTEYHCCKEFQQNKLLQHFLRHFYILSWL